jgi:SnoaL-like domain
VPWVPELFSEPVRVRFLEDRRRRERLAVVPYFAGLLTGETHALIRSFAGEPEVHYPVRGRVKGEQAFAAYAAATKTWLEDREASIEDVGLFMTERRSVGEAVLHLGGDGEHIDLPVAIVADQRPDARLEEIRIYYSSWLLAGRHAHRAPLLQRDPELREPEILGEYQRALAAGDLDSIVACFEPDGYAREPAGADYVHRGAGDLREFYSWLFSNGGGIPLEQCTLTHDDQTYALEYNVARWGRTELPPQAGVAVYVRGDDGRIAAARIYDDVDPPVATAT